MHSETYPSQSLCKVTAAPYYIAERNHDDPHLGPYTASAGLIELSEGGHARGTMSFTAYRKEGAVNRPTTFVWNGGPLSATTLWNAPELTAPWEIAHDSNGHLPARATLTLDKNALLHDSDVVHLDAMGVGYGRAHSGQDPQHFYGVDKDAHAFMAAIRAYRKHYKKEGNPIILAGSSYGIRRAMSVGIELHNEGTDIGGLALISPNYDDALRRFDTDDPRPFITALPALAMAAQYHHSTDKHPNIVRGCRYRAALFAQTDYADALTNNTLPETVIGRAARFLRLPESLIVEQNLRISPQLFQEQFLGRTGLQLSGIDSRLAFRPDASNTFDPALDTWKDQYTPLVVRHFAEHFGYKPDEPYVGNVNAAPHWDYSGLWEERNAKAPAQKLFGTLPGLRVADISGMFDLLSPPERRRSFWEYVISSCEFAAATGDPNAPLAPSGTITHYELFSGHQPGVDPASKLQAVAILRKLARTVAGDHS